MSNYWQHPKARHAENENAMIPPGIIAFFETDNPLKGNYCANEIKEN